MICSAEEIKKPHIRSMANDTEIEICQKHILFSNHFENVEHTQNIRCIFKDGLPKRRHFQELKFKFAAIVMDRLFFYISLAYAIITFVGLVMSM